MSEIQPQMPKGKAIDYTQIEEGWSVYRLDDGNFLRVKHVVTKVLKAEMKNPDGSPIYMLQGTNAVSFYTPQEMVSLRPKFDK